MSNIIVLKFGGSSQCVIGYNSCKRRIEEDRSKKYVICVSALSGITSMLISYTKEGDKMIIERIIEKHRSLINELGLEIGDIIDSLIRLVFLNYQNNLQGRIDLIKLGEKLSSMILNEYLRSEYNVELISAEDIIKSNSESESLYQFRDIRVESNKILESLKVNDIVITQGFMGGTPLNKSFLFGRGGSDTSGAIIANSLCSECYEIWTDVCGIYETDPRIVKEACVLRSISYDMGQELAAMGSKVIHPYCIKPCKDKGIPILIRNSFNYEGDYSRIEDIESNNCGISIQRNNILFKIKSINMWSNYGFVSDIFSVFNNFEIDVDIICTSQFEISLTTLEENMEKLIKVQDRLKERYNVCMRSNLDLISVISNNILELEILDNINRLLNEREVYLLSYSSNKMSVSYLLDNINNKLVNDIYSIIKKIENKNKE